MSTVKPLYAASAALTATLNSLASSATAGRQSDAVDNATSRYRDALLAGQFTVPTGGTVGGDKTIYVYVFASADDGSHYAAERGVAGTQATVGAADAAYTMTDPTVGGSPLIQIASVPVPVAPTTTNGVYVLPPVSVAACFGGTLPKKWGVVVRNYCGITLHSSGNSLWFQGVNDEIV